MHRRRRRAITSATPETGGSPMTTAVRATRRSWEDADAVTATRYVYDFDETADGGRELLGGKGVGLAEMTQLGIPVPGGFTITTDACRAFMREGGLPGGLTEEVDRHVAAL